MIYDPSASCRALNWQNVSLRCLCCSINNLFKIRTAHQRNVKAISIEVDGWGRSTDLFLYKRPVYKNTKYVTGETGPNLCEQLRGKISFTAMMSIMALMLRFGTVVFYYYCLQWSHTTSMKSWLIFLLLSSRYFIF